MAVTRSKTLGDYFRAYQTASRGGQSTGSNVTTTGQSNRGKVSGISSGSTDVNSVGERGLSRSAGSVLARGLNIGLSRTGLREMPGATGAISGAVGDIAQGKSPGEAGYNAATRMVGSNLGTGLRSVGLGLAAGPIASGVMSGITSEGTDTQRGRAAVGGALRTLSGYAGAAIGSVLGPGGTLVGGLIGGMLGSSSFSDGALGDALNSREFEGYRDSLESSLGTELGKQTYAQRQSLTPGTQLSLMEATIAKDKARKMSDMAEDGFLAKIGGFFNDISDIFSPGAGGGGGDYDGTSGYGGNYSGSLDGGRTNTSLGQSSSGGFYTGGDTTVGGYSGNLGGGSSRSNSTGNSTGNNTTTGGRADGPFGTSGVGNSGDSSSGRGDGHGGRGGGNGSDGGGSIR